MKIKYTGKAAIIVGQKTYYTDETFELTDAAFKMLKMTVDAKDLQVLPEAVKPVDPKVAETKTQAQVASSQGAVTMADMGAPNTAKPEQKK